MWHVVLGFRSHSTPRRVAGRSFISLDEFLRESGDENADPSSP
jgi:hypothetical protein